MDRLKIRYKSRVRISKCYTFQISAYIRVYVNFWKLGTLRIYRQSTADPIEESFEKRIQNLTHLVQLVQRCLG